MFGKFALSSALVLSMAGISSAETIKWTAELDQAQEVETLKAVEGAMGNAEGTIDTETGLIDYNITFSKLSGDVVAGHFHGPAAVGENAEPVVEVKGEAGMASPIVGSGTITPEQVEEIKAGKWYLNLHTEANPDGEIRGQVAATQ